VEFRVLGSVGIVDRDTPLPLGGGMPRRLLATLLAYRNTVVSTDRLVEVLWPDDPPASAGATLQSYVSRLRRFVELGDGGPALVNRAPGYVLEAPEDVVDAGRFQTRLREGQALLGPDPYAALDALNAALDEWRGNAFAEFADAEWIRPEAIRLEELRLVAIDARIDADLRVGRHQAVVGELEALLVEHPLREQFARHLMMALYRSGRQAEALRVAHELGRVLRDELGLEPSAALRELEAAVLDARDELAWVPPPAGASGTPSAAGERSRRRAIPAETTPLVGRDRDLELAARLFESGRILTLFGPGGVGKTRLAHRLASTVAPGFADGVRLVELAPVRDPLAVGAAVADALDVQQRPHRSLDDSIVEILAPQQLLLVLDNCEHVIDTTSELVELVLRWCPGVQVLATSREPLGIPAEVVWSVPPLPVPASRDEGIDALADVPAVQLFVARARSASADFVLDDATRAAVAEICIRLDGVPLALELAAARMRSMSPEQLAERLPERFRVLAGSRRATDPRHRNLRDLVRWSYELLTPMEQRLFDRLSVFAGGFVLERAERVCAGGGIDQAEVAGLLGALVDKSMVTAQTSESRTGYRQLETLREFGREQLLASPDAHTVRAAHALVHAELAARAGEGLGGPDEARWAQELDASFDDMREAHGTAIATGDVGRALQIVVGLREYAWRRIRYELLAWADATVTMPGASDHPRFPVALGIVAYGHFVRGELDAAVDVGERAVGVASTLDTPTTGLAERAVANVLFYRGDGVRALQWTERMLAAARVAGLPYLIAHAHYMRSVAETSIGNHDVSAAFAERAAAAAVESGSPTAHAQADYALGVSLETTDPARALQVFDRSVRHAESVDNRWIRAFALTESLWIRARNGEALEALAGYRTVIDTWFRGGDWANQWLSLRHVFAIFEALGHDEAAATLYGALEASGVMQALPIEPANADEFGHAVGRLAARLDERAFLDAVERGRARRDEEVVRYALGEINAIVSAAVQENSSAP
jgi:predicted ATPase/DNA-binding SARP family transcriptional activator